MLIVGKVPRGGQAYYLRTATTSLRPGIEPEGTWAGSLAEHLGLTGTVEPEALDALCDGVDPATGKLLSTSAFRVRNVAYDLTCAAPKSVSLLHALGDPAVAAEVQEGHDAAVAVAFRFLEREGLQARRTVGSERVHIGVEGSACAIFPHHVSRAADPHLHTHVVMANVVLGTDGQWSAADVHGLFRLRKEATLHYQTTLRNELTARLDVGWVRFRHGFADVAGIPREAIDAFSRRSHAIRDVLGVEATAPVAGWRDRRYAAECTRPPKDFDTPPSALLPEWRQRAQAVSLGTAELHAVTHTPFHQRLPSYVTAEIGARPEDATARGQWDHAAEAIASYRERWAITDSASALGASRTEIASRARDKPDLERLAHLGVVQRAISRVGHVNERSLARDSGISM